MDKLIVMDGDFETQLRRNLRKKENLDSAFMLQALRDDKFAVYKTHLDFLRAGAQIIRTNTYRASEASLRTHLNISRDESRTLIYSAVQLAKQALAKHFEESGHEPSTFKDLAERPLVAGSCGSYNASDFDDNTDTVDIDHLAPKFLYRFHQQRIETLLKAGVDLLSFESISSEKEMFAILRVLKSYPNVRALITFLCQPKGHLLDETTFTEAVWSCLDKAQSDQIVAIGSEGALPNSIKIFMDIANETSDLKVPFIFYADKCHFSITEANSKSILSLKDNFVEKWFNSGVRYFGGGIDITAEDIKVIHKQVKAYCSSKGYSSTVLKPCSYRNMMNLSKL